MSNTYLYTLCPHCEKLIDSAERITVHGKDALGLLEELEEQALTLKEIADHFCSDCGSVFGEGDKCSCGSSVRQSVWMN